jgi:hypothetical protein
MTVKEQILELFESLPDVDREIVLQELNLKGVRKTILKEGTSI